MRVFVCARGVLWCDGKSLSECTFVGEKEGKCVVLCCVVLCCVFVILCCGVCVCVCVCTFVQVTAHLHAYTYAFFHYART